MILNSSCTLAIAIFSGLMIAASIAFHNMRLDPKPQIKKLTIVIPDAIHHAEEWSSTHSWSRFASRIQLLFDVRSSGTHISPHVGNIVACKYNIMEDDQNLRRQISRGVFEGLLCETLSFILNEKVSVDISEDSERYFVHFLASDVLSDILRSFKYAAGKTIFTAVVANELNLFSHDFVPNWNSDRKPLGDLWKRNLWSLFVRSVAHTIPAVIIHMSADELHIVTRTL